MSSSSPFGGISVIAILLVIAVILIIGGIVVAIVLGVSKSKK